MQVTVLLCSLAVLNPRVGHTMTILFLHLSLSSAILIDSFMTHPHLDVVNSEN